MDITVTRAIDAPADRVWSLQIRHEEWPSHLPNFRRIERIDHGPFAVGSSARVTQPMLGTVVWTVDALDESPARRTFSWSGTSKGIRYVASHEVVPEGATRSTLTLRLRAEGRGLALFAPVARRVVSRTIAAEAEAFDRWAHEAPSPADAS